MGSQIKNMLRSKLLWLICTVLIITGGGTVAVTHYIDSLYNEISLDDNGHIVQIQTTDKTVEELLNKCEIKLRLEDEISPSLDEPIEEGTIVKIDRAFKVTVLADGKTKDVYLTKGTIEDALDKAYVSLGQKDFTNYNREEAVNPGDYIRVTRVKEEILIEKEGIPYKVVTQDNSKLEKGLQKVVQEGKEGEKQRKILIAYHDGVEVNRDMVEETVAQEPVNRVIDKGTYVAPKPTPKPAVSRGSGDRSKATSEKKTSSSSAAPSAPSKATAPSGSLKTFQATSYTHTGNKTRTGVWPKQGMIAVDPKVIPLHTKVYVEFSSPYAHLTGYYMAMDTGGAIKGNIIDVFLPDGGTKQFGRRTVKVSW
ncbi:MAG TPA: G5 domain-containing protein [Clostridia bacterium]|nr:G5 domain-containing protein [Clostridia bacterium]